MMGPEYKRSRLLRAAELLRAAKISSFRDLVVSCWTEERRHVVEVLNRETGKSSQLVFTSAIDVPTYAEFIEAVMSRCRV